MVNFRYATTSSDRSILLTRLQEAHTGVIELPDNDPLVVERIVYWLYHGENNYFPSTTTPATYERHPFLLHAQVYTIGEQYNLACLKKTASDKYEKTANIAWDTSAFVTSLQLIYEATPQSDKDIREVVSSAAVQHGRDLVNCPEFSKLCNEVGKVGYRILGLIFGPAHKLRGVRLMPMPSCPSCKSEQFVTERSVWLEAVEQQRPNYYRHHCQKCEKFFN